MRSARAASGQAASKKQQRAEASSNIESQTARSHPTTEGEDVDAEDNFTGAPSAGPEDVAAPSVEASDEADEIRREIEQVKRLVTTQRLRADLQSLRTKAAGGTPAEYVDIEGTHLPSRKRAASSQETPENLKLLKLASPPAFDGKSIKALQKYDNAWKASFRAMPQIADDAYATRIAMAATHLTGIALQAWVRETKEYTKWEDYISFLRSTVSDPATRKSEALLSLAAKRQRTDQSVRDLLAEVEQLEEDIPPMSEEERQAWTLLNALTPALRAEVIRENKEITSREQVLASAQRHEEISKARAKAETRKENRPAPVKETTGDSASSRSRAASQTSAESLKGKKFHKPFPIECYNCGKKGHLAKECRSRKKSRSPKDKEGEQPKK